MVSGTNSMPAGIFSLECSEKRNFIQCKQFNCDTAPLWNSMAVSWPSGKFSLRVDTVQLCSGETYSVFEFQPGKHSFHSVFGGKEKWPLQVIGVVTYIDRSPHSLSLNGLPSCK